MNSIELLDRSLKIAPGGVHSPVRAFKSVGGTPVFFKGGRGALLTSVEGKSYIDFCQSFGPLLLGHRDADVHAAALRALEDGWVLGTCEPYSLELAEWVTRRLPFVEKLRFVSSGTEAVMSALRVARAATSRSKILKFEGCYHGHADSLLVKAGSGLAGESASDSAGISQAMAGETLVVPLDDEAAITEVFQARGSEIAALILEPMPANYGLLLQRKEFLMHAIQTARAHGALVIFDEVISGFRVSLGGMAELLGVKPDLVTYGKIIGGGFPVGAYGGRRELLDLVAPAGPVYQAGTLSANPIGMRAGLAALQKIEATDAHAVLEKRGAAFVAELNALFKDVQAPFAVARQASVFWIHPAKPGELAPIRSLKDLPAELNARFSPLFAALLEEGIYLPPSGYEVGFLSLAHDDAVLARTLDLVKRALGRMSAR